MDKKPDQWWSSATYADAKRCIRENIQSLARDYIAIGFYLRRIRDGKQFLEDGYISIHEFAYAEFGMRKSTVNHCIRINAEFSEGGNSPAIDARYKEFGKTQLQELLYVPEDKRDEATPDMTVAEIRKIHKPERLDNEPGQSEEQRLDDEPEENEKSGREKSAVDSSKNEFATEPVQVPEKEKLVAVHFTADPAAINNSYGATFAEIVERYLDTEYLSEPKECKVYIGWRMYRVLKRPKVTAFYDDIGKFMFDVENERLEQEYQAMLKEKDTGTFPKDLKSSTEPGGQDGEVKGETAGKTENIHDPEIDMVDAGCPEDTVKITVQDLLHQKQRELDEWMEAMGDDDCASVPGIVELGIIVQALEILAGQQGSQERLETENETRDSVPGVDLEEVMAEVAKARGIGKKALDEIRKRVERLFRKDGTSMESGGQDMETLEEVSGVKEQPTLPVLKNNEQRKEWLGKYQDWGLWYEDGNIGVKYYRYCFENGADLIVEEYQDHSEYAGDYTSSYFHLVGGPKAVQKNGISRWQRHERYSKFPNSETELVEFLKFVQKGGEKPC